MVQAERDRLEERRRQGEVIIESPKRVCAILGRLAQPGEPT